MSGYGYSNRGYTSYNGMEPRNEGWTSKTSYNGMEPRNEGWTSKTSYGGDDRTYPADHLCRPVILDAEGRKHPIISYNSATPNHNTEAYIAKAEQQIVEHLQIPMVTEYKYSSSTNYPTKEYSGFGNAPTTNSKWGKPPSSSIYESRPQKVEEFISEIQSEISRPSPTNKTSLLGSSSWRQNPNSTGYNSSSNNNNNGYNDYDYSNKDWNKSNARPWSTTPNYDAGAALSKPTSDIGAAVEYLKEVATKPSSTVATSGFPQPRFTVTVPRRENYLDTTSIDSRPKRDAYYTETIDSRDAARKYGNGNVNGSTRPFVAVDPYAPTIDSREALKKYYGTNV